MWGFPSFQIYFSGYGFAIVWFLGVLVACIFAWVSFYVSITQGAKESDGDFIKNIGLGTVTFGILVLGFWLFVSDYRETSGCRNLDLNQVKAAYVRKMSDENSFTGSTLIYEDSNKLRESLKSLRNASNYSRRKIDGRFEKFTLGYQVQLILENDSASPTINYFYENDRSRKLNVVIPQCTVSANGINSQGDSYASTEFGNWIRDEIVPQFKNAQ